MRAKLKSNQHDKLVEKIHKLMAIDGQAGLVAKVCVLAGLTEDEALYCYNQEICDNSCCNCHKLHIINKRNGMTIVIINWARDHDRKIYFALMPTLLWDRFRALTAFNESDIGAADKVVKESVGIELSCVCKIFYSLMQKMMNSDQVAVLVGNAKPCAARWCLLFELDEMLERYVRAWENAGIVLPVI
jgi:hypothetical protein